MLASHPVTVQMYRIWSSAILKKNKNPQKIARPTRTAFHKTGRKLKTSAARLAVKCANDIDGRQSCHSLANSPSSLIDSQKLSGTFWQTDLMFSATRSAYDDSTNTATTLGAEIAN